MRIFKYEKSMDHLSADHVGLLVQIDLELSRRLFQSLSIGQGLCLAFYLFRMAVFIKLIKKHNNEKYNSSTCDKALLENHQRYFSFNDDWRLSV